MRTPLPFIFAALLVSGCSRMGTFAYGQAGYFNAYDRESGHQGGAMEAGVDAYTFDEVGVAAGGGLGVRLKYGDELFQFALSESFLLLFTPRLRGLTPFFRGSLGMLQFERVDGAFAFGMFSPSAELGLMIRVSSDDAAPSSHGPIERRRRRGLALTLSVTTEYDLRFGSAHENRGYWGIRLGIVRAEEVMNIPREFSPQDGP